MNESLKLLDSLSLRLQWLHLMLQFDYLTTMWLLHYLLYLLT